MNFQEPKPQHQFATHFNGNLVCSIDIETTGVKPGYHDIIQLAVLPLDSQFRILKVMADGTKVYPFEILIKPERPENIDQDAMSVNRLQMSEIMAHGLESFTAIDLLNDWFKKLHLPYNKRIMPLAQNWVFEYGFLKAWLGPDMFAEIFDARYRDTMVSSLYLNDRADFHHERYPFPKNKLSYLASQLKVEQIKAHEALSDCVTTAEVYRRMMRLVHTEGQNLVLKDFEATLKKLAEEGNADAIAALGRAKYDTEIHFF